MSLKKPKIDNAFSRHRVIQPRLPDEEKPRKTKTEFAKQVNINTIMARLKSQNLPEWSQAHSDLFQDLTQLPETFTDAFNIVADARSAFETLPLALRREIDHDPRNLLYVDRAMLEKHGLLKPGGPGGSLEPSGSSGNPEGQGDRDLPGKAPTGAKNKAGKADAPSE